MDLSELKNRICESFTGTADDLEEVLKIVETDSSVFPFNEYEHLICNLIEKSGLTYQQYLEIRSEYVADNPNLWIFEISAPRGFGEKFAETYVRGMCPDLKKSSKKLDADCSGQYDMWLDGIRIEVKALRAVDSNSDEPLYIKVLSRTSKKPFLMNFQQLKPQCCDVFIWVAVFRNEIVLWVMSSDEVANHALFSKGQHRGNKGNEGQLHMKDDNIHLFDEYVFNVKDLGEFIKNAAKRGES